jgi:hypothetical protein
MKEQRTDAQRIIDRLFAGHGYEATQGGDRVIVVLPEGMGWVTIYPRFRLAVPGHGSPPHRWTTIVDPDALQGRGWQEKLADTVVEWARRQG